MAAYHDGFIEGCSFSQTGNVAFHESSHFHEGFVSGCSYSKTTNAFEAPAHVYQTTCNGELEPRVFE